MVIVGISGSPRRKGNTERLVSEVLEGAAEAGGETMLFSVADGDIEGCTGCMRCRKVPRCSIDDRMTLIYDALMRADALVFSSPIYMGQMTSQAKAVVDRFYALLNNDGTPRFRQGMPLFPLFTQAQKRLDIYSPYFHLCEDLFTHMGFEVMAPLVAGCINLKGEIESHTDLLASARKMGRKMGAGGRP